MLNLVQFASGKSFAKIRKLISAWIWSDFSVLVSPSELRQVQKRNSLEFQVQSKVDATKFNKFAIDSKAEPQVSWLVLWMIVQGPFSEISTVKFVWKVKKFAKFCEIPWLYWIVPHSAHAVFLCLCGGAMGNFFYRISGRFWGCGERGFDTHHTKSALECKRDAGKSPQCVPLAFFSSSSSPTHKLL